MPASRAFAPRTLAAVVLSWSSVALGQEKPMLDLTVTVDFGEDVGQNFGTLFEARGKDGRLAFGAGFAAVYNTRFRLDRHTVQFFVRGVEETSPTWERLPKPSTAGGAYLFDFDGMVGAWNQTHDRAVRVWDAGAGKWRVDESFAGEKMIGGDGKLRVAGKVLQFIDGDGWYDGKQILTRPEVGRYHHFYFANGHLVFSNYNRDADPPWTKVYAVPWQPQSGQPVDVGKASVLQTKYAGETPFAIGQLGSHVIYTSNQGGVYRFDAESKRWDVLVEADNTVSYQVYSTVNYYDRLLLSQYPTGNLFEYDGKTVRRLEGQPPRMEGVVGYAREAQSTMLYGGDLYVGVWPWAELWRLDPDSEQWSFVRRFFTAPPVTDEVGHPWEREVTAYNEQFGKQMHANAWGHRVTSMAPWRDALALATSAKGPWTRNEDLAFLTDEVWDEYGRVFLLRKSGALAATTRWKDGPTTLRFVADATGLSIYQEGKKLGTSATAVTPRTTEVDLSWGQGMFGPLGGKLVDHAVR